MANFVMPFSKEAESVKPTNAPVDQSGFVMPNFVTKEQYLSLKKQEEKAKKLREKSIEQSRAISELPSILDVGLSNFLGPKVSDLDALKASAAILATPDQQGQINIIKSTLTKPGTEKNPEYIEPISVAYDPQGNAILNINGRLAMLNKPGADLFDVAQFAGQAAMFMPAGRVAATAKTIGAGALKAALASSATQAGISAGTQIAGRQAPISQLGAEVGMAGVGGGLGEVGGRIISAAIARRTGNAINATDEALLRQEAQKQGLSVDDLSNEIIAQAQKQASSAVSPETKLALQGEKEFGIPLTAGQRMGPTAGAAQLSLEERLKTGVSGEKAQQIMLAMVGPEGEQTKAIDTAREALVNRLTYGRSVPSGKQNVGEFVSEAVKQQEAIASNKVNEAYAAIGKAELSGKGFVDLLNATRKSISGIEYPKNKEIVPAANALNKEINKAIKFFSEKQIKQIKPVDIKQIESVRRTLRSYYNAAQNPTDRRNIQTMSAAFDDYLDSAVARSLFDGDMESIEALKNARGTFADYASKFRAKPIKTPSGTIQDPVGKFIEKIIAEDPNGTQVVNALFGANGFSSSTGQKMAKRMKQIVGADSDAWMSVKREAFDRLIQTEKWNGKDFVSGSKTLSAISKAQENNSELLKEIFSQDELSTIKRFALQVKRTQPDFIKSRENPSGTAQVASKALPDLVNKLRNIFNLSGDLGINATNFGIDMVSGLSGRAKARAAIKPFSEQFSAPTISVPVGAAGALQYQQNMNQ